MQELATENAELCGALLSLSARLTQAPAPTIEPSVACF